MAKHNGQTIALIIMAVMATWIGIIEACSCLAQSDQPRYCGTDFFALLLITDEQTNDKSMSREYHFQPISIISDKQRLLDTYNTLYTYSSSAACGVKLRPGDRYLIGGNVDRQHGRLLLQLCRSFVERYVRPSTVMTEDFQILLQHCGSSDQNENAVVIDKRIESIGHAGDARQ
ncbi:hypothetical protein BLA29_009516, partial [Euroglyphus maynei]